MRICTDSTEPNRSTTRPGRKSPSEYTRRTASRPKPSLPPPERPRNAPPETPSRDGRPAGNQPQRDPAREVARGRSQDLSRPRDHRHPSSGRQTRRDLPQVVSEHPKMPGTEAILPLRPTRTAGREQPSTPIGGVPRGDRNRPGPRAPLWRSAGCRRVVGGEHGDAVQVAPFPPRPRNPFVVPRRQLSATAPRVQMTRPDGPDLPPEKGDRRPPPPGEVPGCPAAGI